jgi:hypothetical protein
LIVLTVFHVGCFILNVALVLGLRALQPWARWTELVVALVFLMFCLIYVGDVCVNRKPWVWIFITSVPGTILIAWVVYVLLSPRIAIVFSKECRADSDAAVRRVKARIGVVEDEIRERNSDRDL